MKKYLLGIFAIVLAVGFSAFTMPQPMAFDGFYRFTLNDPSQADDNTYVENVNNWSSNLVEVDLDDLQCPTGTYQPCEIITAVADVNSGTGKLKGTISTTIGSNIYYLVSGYTPTTGTSDFNNQEQ